MAFATFGGNNYLPVTVLVNVNERIRAFRKKRSNDQLRVSFSLQTSLKDGIIMFAMQV